MSDFPVLRSTGVVLGAVSLMLLSVPALGLQFSGVFQSVIDDLASAFDRIFRPLEVLLIQPVIDWLFFVDLHLQKHWHYVFVLLWLFNGTYARNIPKHHSWQLRAILIFWSGFTALIAAASTGVMPLDSWAVLCWPLGGIVAFLAGVNVSGYWALPQRESETMLYVAGPRTLMGFATVALLAYVGSNEPMTAPFDLEVPSYGLLLLALAVALFGLVTLLLALVIVPRLVGEQPLPLGTDPLSGMGLDILATFGFAIFFALLGFLIE